MIEASECDNCGHLLPRIEMSDLEGDDQTSDIVCLSCPVCDHRQTYAHVQGFGLESRGKEQ
jgi:ssDNA-binding Zn-finger/Zn-ribbon topoisomerase 1